MFTKSTQRVGSFPSGLCVRSHTHTAGPSERTLGVACAAEQPKAARGVAVSCKRWPGLICATSTQRRWRTCGRIMQGVAGGVRLGDWPGMRRGNLLALVLLVPLVGLLQVLQLRLCSITA